ncbi:MAG: SPOR domain-containing protein, partial [Gemmatimonadetes bacterium]|nr:SPOR domain-containing protein [Gemmatimonadota bacterium]
ARVLGYSEEDDQIYLINPNGVLVGLDLGTGRSRKVDSSIAAATAGPTGTPFVVHTDGSVAMVEHRNPVAWPTAKLSQAPTGLVGAGRGMLLVEMRARGKRELLTLSANRPTVTQEIPEGRVIASSWGDAVLITTDSGLVTFATTKVQPPNFHALRTRPTAVALSPSSHRIYAAQDRRLTVYERFRWDDVARRDLPGTIAEIRPDPFGRYLLLRPAAGDSIWLFDVSTNRYVATIGGTWSEDLPTVAADGSIITRQRSDVVAIAGDSLTTQGRVRGAAGDRWLALAWDPRRPALQLAEQAEEATENAGDILYVQVSVSQNEAWAQDYAQDLKKAGMNASVLPPSSPDEGYRVVLGPYPAREAAEDAGRRLGRPFWVFSRGQAPSTP